MARQLRGQESSRYGNMRIDPDFARGHAEPHPQRVLLQPFWRGADAYAVNRHPR